MSRTIEISAETVDNLVTDALISDYKNIISDIKRMENRGTAIQSWELEDLENWQKIKSAMEVILRHYLVNDVYERLVAEYK